MAERRGSFAARQASHPAPAARHRKALRRALRARRPALTALLGFLGWSVPLSAHDFWIEPSSFRVAGGEPITLSLRVGEAFHGEPVPRDPAHARRFAVLGPAGETSVLGRPGSHPAGFLPPLAPGTYVAVYGSAASELELDGAHFEQYLREEGLEAVAAERAARGQTAAPARERFSRCAKALVTVGEGEGVAAGFDRVVGLRLELFTEADPRRLTPGAELPVRLLLDGQPLPGALVVALPAADPEERVAARTDAEGRVRLRLKQGGAWLLKSVHMLPAPANSGADWESLWASLTFEVAADSAMPP